ncbi:3-oxoacyl-reductase [Clathrospora elynae]|uniref:3-oxoacyl-reductase n=1 Tax=Clathrospora elynae TaxID=706981 RepID=A0A6A5STM8_9PLEO|nr:3-oxoacyl-reductase [Clathrospora elynae]
MHSRKNSLWSPTTASSSAQTPQLLSGKTMAITGGVTGIGRAIVLGYLAHGASVAVNHFGDDKSASQFQSLVEEAAKSLNISKEDVEKRLVEVPGDVGNPETGKKLVAAVVERWGRLDVVISNAGICEFKEFLEITPDLWTKTLTTNLTGAFHTIQAAAHQLSSQSPPGGSIIGISSISALVGGAHQGHYTPTKAGVLSLIQSSACALGKYNIRCNALLPGTIKTQLNEKDLEDEEKRKYMEGRIPLGRTGVPGDMAGPAVFLGSDLSSYVSGAQLLVDGGLFVNLQ